MQNTGQDRDGEYLVGIISDTHGLVRPEAVSALRGVRLIIHAGDVGNADVLEKLQAIAPVIAVRGNTDRGGWAFDLPQTEVAGIGGSSLYILHDIHDLDLDPVASGFSAVISGHSHKPFTERRNGVLFLNPGSAGPRRFNLPVTVALLRIKGRSLEPHIIELEV